MGSYTQKAAIARCKHDDSQGTVCNCKEVCFSSQAFGTSRFFQPKKQGTRFRFLEPKKSQSKIIKQLNLGPYCLKVRELKRWSYLTWSFTPTSSLHRRHFLASIRETFQSSGKESEINCGPKSIQFTHQSSPSICGLKKSSISRFSHETFAAMCAGTARGAAHVPRP